MAAKVILVVAVLNMIFLFAEIALNVFGVALL
jgi:uncharacterized membrane protein